MPGIDTDASAKVSVAMCTYNGVQHVEAQVASILTQERPPDELVVADDGSTDQTLDVALSAIRRALAVGELRVVVKVLTPESSVLGVTANFERALRACTGDVVLLADQDDQWCPKKIRRILDLLSGPRKPLLVASNATLTNIRGEPLGVDLFKALRVSGHEIAAMSGESPLDAALRRNVLAGMTCGFRSELLTWALPIPPFWPHDSWLVAVAATMGRLQVSEESLVRYRQHGANAVGATRHSIRLRVSRALKSERTADLYAQRYAALLLRAEGFDGLDPAALNSIRAKVAFENARRSLAHHRLRRLPQLLHLVATRKYSAYASNGIYNALRDALAHGSV